LLTIVFGIEVINSCLLHPRNHDCKMVVIAGGARRPAIAPFSQPLKRLDHRPQARGATIDVKSLRLDCRGWRSMRRASSFPAWV
jgi:hypothetical protein